MKNFFLILFLFFITLRSFEQKGIDGLVQAEKNFAAYSVSHSTKEAFLKFLDSVGVIFENGKWQPNYEKSPPNEQQPKIEPDGSLSW